MDFLLGGRFVSAELVQEVLGSLDMRERARLIKRLHKDEMSVKNLTLVFGESREDILEILDSPFYEDQRDLLAELARADEPKKSKYARFIEKNAPVTNEEIERHFGITYTYASKLHRDYDYDHQKVIASGTVEVNGEERENVLVIQMGCAGKIQEAIENNRVRFGGSD